MNGAREDAREQSMDGYTPVTVWHLEMLDPAALRPVQKEPAGLAIAEARLPLPELNRFLYTAVGGDWFWRERLSWDYARWIQVLAQPGYETWVAYLHGTPAGYFELEAQADGSVEIAYFGLLPQFFGRGIGGRLLTQALARGWEKGARRIWVHTCSLDHPAALANYQARGLVVFKEETVYVPDVTEPPGAWPGANRPVHR
jgi:ribosomal protein S18 acetylase RimI-like enzyme